MMISNECMQNQQFQKNLALARGAMEKVNSKYRFASDETFPVEYDGEYEGAPCTYIINPPDEDGMCYANVRFKDPI